MFWFPWSVENREYNKIQTIHYLTVFVIQEHTIDTNNFSHYSLIWLMKMCCLRSKQEKEEKKKRMLFILSERERRKNFACVCAIGILTLCFFFLLICLHFQNFHDKSESFFFFLFAFSVKMQRSSCTNFKIFSIRVESKQTSYKIEN